MKVRDTPLSQRIYFGWWIVSVLMLVGMMAFGAGLYAFTLFMAPLAEEFGWGRGAISGAISVFWISAPIIPFVGLMCEKYGARNMILAGTILEGISLVLIGHIDSLSELYALRVLMGIGKIMMIVPIPIVVAAWFDRKNGFALGITLAGWHFGGVVLSPLAQYLITTYDWRYAASFLGYGILLLVIPAVMFILKHEKPQDIGLLPDGESKTQMGNTQESGELNDSSEIDDSYADLTFQKVVKGQLFWVILGTTAIYYFGYAAILTQEAAYFTDIGISATTAANALSMTAFIAIFGVISFGYAVDRHSTRLILLIVFIMIGLSAVLLMLVGSIPQLGLLYLFIIIFGLSIGAGDVIWLSLLKGCYGNKLYGKVFSIWYFVSLALISIGPIAAGMAYDYTQSYNTIFNVVLAGSIVSFITIMFVKMPKNELL